MGKKTELLGTQADDEFLLEAEFPFDKDAVTANGYVPTYDSSTGKYIPLPSAGVLSFLLTTEGGIIYDSNGELVLKG